MPFVARLVQEALDPAAELAALTTSATGAGAVVSFIGLARPASKTGHELQTLVLEHHPRLTAKSLSEIASDALDRFDICQAHVVHRCGSIIPGEAIVFAGAASAHRKAAFEAADYLMDRLKTEAVFWKREESSSSFNWIEPTEADYEARQRWE